LTTELLHQQGRWHQYDALHVCHLSVHNYVHGVLTWPQKVDHSWPNQETA